MVKEYNRLKFKRKTKATALLNTKIEKVIRMKIFTNCKICKEIF